MKPKTCGYSHTYPLGISGQFEKIWIEVELQDGDDPRQALYHCKKTVENFHFESNKAAEKEVSVQGAAQQKLSQSEQIIKDISTCKDLKVLQAYQLIAKNNPQLQDAYDKKLKELDDFLTDEKVKIGNEIASVLFRDVDKKLLQKDGINNTKPNE